MVESETVRNLIHEVVKDLPTELTAGKCGQKVLQPKLATALNNAGYNVDKEDMGVFLRREMPVWRNKNTGEIEDTKARRLIDIVVRRNGRPVALIEVESDLNNLQRQDTGRQDHRYNVLSIARSADGLHFNSYRSLERMAAAAFYFHLMEHDEVHQRTILIEKLVSIRSNRPEDHNPAALPMFLACGSCRKSDMDTLGPRLKSLGAQLLPCVVRNR
ncbi:MAG TPA: type I restriction enzyme HsdR N-terminal domain-containing protein [Rhizomicrobium sp.]